MEYFVIDHMEDGIAVLEQEDGSHRSVPESELPLDVKEGDVLFLQGESYLVDVAETDRRRAAANALLKELFGE